MAQGLTDRQQAVLDRIKQGMTPVQIADDMDLSYNGVQSHLKRLRAKGLIPKRRGSSNRRNGSRRASGGNRSTAVSTSGNGGRASGSTVRVGSAMLDGIPSLDKAMDELNVKIGNLDEETESITTRRKTLSEELHVLEAREQEVALERERLAGVQDRIMEAVK